MSQYVRWSSSVIGPTPSSWSSTERSGVTSAALPGGGHRPDPAALALLAEVRRRRRAHDRDVDGVAARVHAELAVAVEGNRTQVALGEPGRGHELVAGGAKLLERVREL